MSETRAWTCESCQSEQTHESWCEACHKARFRSFDVMVSEHVLEHIADGLATPLEIQKAMNDRPCYARIRGGFELRYIVQRIRMLTNDTTDLARKLMRAQSAKLALEAMAAATPADKIRILEKWGPVVNTEYTETKVDAVTRHVVELHEGPPPKGEQ